MNKNILHCVIVYYKQSLAIGQLKVGLTFDARMLQYTEEFSSVTARCSVPVGAK